MKKVLFESLGKIEAGTPYVTVNGLKQIMYLDLETQRAITIVELNPILYELVFTVEYKGKILDSFDYLANHSADYNYFYEYTCENPWKPPGEEWDNTKKKHLYSYGPVMQSALARSVLNQEKY